MEAVLRRANLAGRIELIVGAPRPTRSRSTRFRERPSNLYGLQHRTMLVTMTAVSISDLKANLSRYLREVRRGGEVHVLDRGAPVAADAQLGAALLIQERLAGVLTFVCLDHRLSSAAELESLRVVQ